MGAVKSDNVLRSAVGAGSSWHDDDLAFFCDSEKVVHTYTHNLQTQRQGANWRSRFARQRRGKLQQESAVELENISQARAQVTGNSTAEVSKFSMRDGAELFPNILRPSRNHAPLVRR